MAPSELHPAFAPDRVPNPTEETNRRLRRCRRWHRRERRQERQGRGHDPIPSRNWDRVPSPTRMRLSTDFADYTDSIRSSSATGSPDHLATTRPQTDADSRATERGQFLISPQQIRPPHLLSWSLVISYWAFMNLPYPIPPAIPEIILRVTRRAIPRVTQEVIRGANRRATRTANRRVTRKAILPATRRPTPEAIGRAIPKIARGIPRRTVQGVIRRAIFRAIGRITRRITRGTSGRVACPAIRRAV